MRIYIDIAHPAYAHALRFFIAEMEKNGHEILVSARDKDVTHSLLKSWGIEFIDRGRGAESMPGKIIYLLRVLYNLFPVVRKFRPDMVLSWSSYHAALIGRITGVPVITFEDTEPVPLLHSINRLLSSQMVTPSCFEMDLGNSHIRFSSYKELASLHPSRFKPVRLPEYIEKPYIIMRFVSWRAWHDNGHPGIGEKMKHVIAERLSEFAKVYISSEDTLPPGLSQYQLNCDCDSCHSVLAGATLLFGESASMAAEAAVLGVPAIYIDNAGRGYTRELENKYSLMFSFAEDDKGIQNALGKAVDLLGDKELLSEWQKRRMKMLEEKGELVSWMVKMVENFPEKPDK